MLHSTIYTRTFLLGLVALALCACSEDVIIPPAPRPDPNVDPRDPRFILGQMLFFDRELSGNRDIACSTCHVPFLATAEPLELSIGHGGTGTGPTRSLGQGTILPRNTPALFFLGGPEASALFWDGRVERRPNGSLSAPVSLPPGLSTPLEALSLFPLLDRAEMRGFPGDGATNELAEISDGSPRRVWQQIVDRLMAFEPYRMQFAQAFPNETPTIAHVGRALAIFQRGLWERSDSRFDEFERGEATLEEAEEQGRLLFFGDAGCARCHSGSAFSDFDFHNIAVPQLGPGRDGNLLDEGRGAVTGRQQDRFAFRTPSLRNVRMTAPYMHDGAYQTLEEAVRHHLDPEASLRAYDGAVLPATLRSLLHDDPETLDAILETLDPETVPLRPLSDEDVSAIIAFLATLDGRVELVKGPDANVPESVPSGLPVDRWPGGGRPF